MNEAENKRWKYAVLMLGIAGTFILAITGHDGWAKEFGCWTVAWGILA